VIKIVVPGSPGGPTDVMARHVSQHLQQILGQTVVVENRARGGESVAAKVVASAEPDAYTLQFCNTSITAMIPAVSKRPEYSPVKDFAGAKDVRRAGFIAKKSPQSQKGSCRRRKCLKRVRGKLEGLLNGRT
jgi:tripartite-type tricarboxylate transporter receptor subunit TctC